MQCAGNIINNNMSVMDLSHGGIEMNYEISGNIRPCNRDITVGMMHSQKMLIYILKGREVDDSIH